jgi:hypothetical protein
VTVAEACGLLERMLRAYCGQQTDADALERQYRRLKYAASHPRTATRAARKRTKAGHRNS